MTLDSTLLSVHWSHFQPLGVPGIAWRRSQWPGGLKQVSAADLLLGMRVWIPPGKWLALSWECWVFSGRVLCDGPILRPGVLSTVVCQCVWSRDLKNEAVLARLGLLLHEKNNPYEKHKKCYLGPVSSHMKKITLLLDFIERTFRHLRIKKGEIISEKCWCWCTWLRNISRRVKHLAHGLHCPTQLGDKVENCFIRPI